MRESKWSRHSAHLIDSLDEYDIGKEIGERESERGKVYHYHYQYVRVGEERVVQLLGRAAVVVGLRGEWGVMCVGSMTQ